MILLRNTCTSHLGIPALLVLYRLVDFVLVPRADTCLPRYHSPHFKTPLSFFLATLLLPSVDFVLFY